MPWTDETIHTERLLLRAPVEADRPLAATLLTDPQIRRFLGGPVELDADFEAHPLGEQPGVWAVVVPGTGERIGSCSVITERRDRLELSYQFVPSSWGRGYAFEACRAVIGWGWAATDAPDIIAVTQVANERSLALLTRLGFTEEDRFVEFDALQSLQVLHRPG